MPSIDDVVVSTMRIPTDAPESDGTLEWHATTAVVCEVAAAGRIGVGYTYASRAAAVVIEDTLRDCVLGASAYEPRAAWMTMRRAVRNVGEPGVAAMALSAVDIALWDLLARLLETPLYRVLGAYRSAVPAYGSGGFTSYTAAQMQTQLQGWIEAGLDAFKIKVGRDPSRDVERVRHARSVIGGDAQLYVDANGAYGRREALTMGEAFADLGVTWYEEPVSSDDAAGLAWLRERCPPGLRIAAGEYGYRADDFKALLDAGAVDVLMADATRCGGVTGFMQAAALAAAYHVPLSSHCAPTVHRHLACAAPEFETAEYFHDHARLEPMLFTGAAQAVDGMLKVDDTRAGLGISLKSASSEAHTANVAHGR